jgi:hypothetical protein
MRQAADREALAVDEQMIELAAVALKLRPGVEDLAEDVLHDTNVLANAERAAEPFLHVRRGREVIRVDVGLEDPLDLKPLVPDERDDLVRRVRCGPARGGVVVQDRIHDCAAPRCGIAHNMTRRIRRLVEERDYLWLLLRLTERLGDHVTCPEHGQGGVVISNCICRHR